MSPSEADLDLDFTKVLRARPAAAAALPVPAPAAAVPAVAAPVPVAAALAPAQPAVTNLVCYARAGSGLAARAAEAPILVVEDHDPSGRMLGRMLELQAHGVRMAADSRDSARELRNPPLPKLILLDVGLPRVSGFDILAHLRQHPRTSVIPVILV